MSARSGLDRRIGWGVRALVAVSAPVVLFAAPAAAETTGNIAGHIAIKQSNPQVGCAYEVNSGDLYRLRAGDQARDNFAGGGITVTFFDDGATIGTGTVGDGPNGWGQAKVSWTPKTAGQHILTATAQFATSSMPMAPLTVQVRAATSTGSFSCLPSFFG
ncbi:Ig-like domain-containing protein [Nocardia sp. NPDC005746]|uniref:Ig-like domain-containing protein n=1 Tax=Nocardia sp. NPDC005746 TaxID=3157062 RepID=UPI0033E3DB49